MVANNVSVGDVLKDLNKLTRSELQGTLSTEVDLKKLLHLVTHVREALDFLQCFEYSHAVMEAVTEHLQKGLQLKEST